MGTKSKITIGAITYDAEEFDDIEMDRFEQAWKAANTFYNDAGEPYEILKAEHKAMFLQVLKIAKSYFNGQRFAGQFPNDGEFGFRWPQVEDLVGATDTEWGATTGGTANWTAGQRAWICSGAQNSGAYPQTAIILQNATASQKWFFVMFGVRSFNYNPVVKDVIINIAQEAQSIQQVEDKLRASPQRVALFDEAYLLTPERSVQVGLTIREAGPDQLYPIGFSIVQGNRAKDLTYDRPSAA